MAERKKAKKKGKEVEVVCEVPLKPSKEEYAIAKYLRGNLPTKRTKFLQHTVEFFTASKAVDMLMDSPWSSDKSKTSVKFTSREEIVEYMDIMLRHKFFHRARRVPVTARDLRGKALKKFQEEQERLKELERLKAQRDKKRRRQQKGGDKSDTGGAGGDGGATDAKTSGDEKSPSDTEATGKKDDEPSTKKDGEKEKDGDAKEKGKDKDKDDKSKGPKRRIKLEMHLDQLFVDGNDAYVWIYDPTPWYYWLLSILVVLGAIALCLFPLWPSSVRKGVYYLSLAAAGFLVFILGLALLRMAVFCFVWCLTFGRHHLWLLPNLTEDVGFFASFWPLFQYEYKGSGSKDKKKKRDKKGEDGEEDESSGSGSESEESDEDESKQTDSESSKKKRAGETDDGEKKSKSSSAPQTPSQRRAKDVEEPGDVRTSNRHGNEDDEDEGSQSSRNSQQTDKEFEIIGTGEVTEEDVPDHE